MTLEELFIQLRKLANKAEVEELYLELLESEVPTDPDVLTYGIYRERVGVEIGKKLAFAKVMRMIVSNFGDEI